MSCSSDKYCGNMKQNRTWLHFCGRKSTWDNILSRRKSKRFHLDDKGKLKFVKIIVGLDKS